MLRFPAAACPPGRLSGRPTSNPEPAAILSLWSDSAIRQFGIRVLARWGILIVHEIEGLSMKSKGGGDEPTDPK
jgi:hypothetical protein